MKFGHFGGKKSKNRKFSKFFKNVDFWADFDQTSKEPIFTNFKDFLLIFGANESWDAAPKNKKVFYPPH